MPRIIGVDHVALVTPAHSHPLLGLLRWPEILSCSMPSGVLVAKYGLGGTQLEIVVPECRPTPVDGFIEERGQGLHHLALVAAGDIGDHRTALAAAGFQPSPIERGADGRPSLFLHPRGCGGALIEIVQEPR